MAASLLADPRNFFWPICAAGAFYRTGQFNTNIKESTGALKEGITDIAIAFKEGMKDVATGFKEGMKDVATGFKDVNAVKDLKTSAEIVSSAFKYGMVYYGIGLGLSTSLGLFTLVYSLKYISDSTGKYTIQIVRCSCYDADTLQFVDNRKTTRSLNLWKQSQKIMLMEATGMTVLCDLHL